MDTEWAFSSWVTSDISLTVSESQLSWIVSAGGAGYVEVDIVVRKEEGEIAGEYVVTETRVIGVELYISCP